jgi:predicted dithiol-disulfide oxidoreductase (DUF899 family)
MNNTHQAPVVTPAEWEAARLRPNGTAHLPDLFEGRRQLLLPQVRRFSWLNRHDEYGPTETSATGSADHAHCD